MISLIIYFYLFTLSLSLTNHSIQLNNEKIINRTNIQNNFDIKFYRSSWKFIDKQTVLVRFRLDEFLLKTMIEKRFLVRHLRTNLIHTYNEPHETINSTIILYLHNINHGRHTVCLLLYRTKFMINPKYIFCQDIVFNFQKFGHHDMDFDEYKNTFVFLLTQYSIVIGMLCILQIIYSAKKRRFLRVLYHKANALRSLMSEHYHRTHEQRSTTDINSNVNALEYLIYNLNRNALLNIDQMYRETTNVIDDSSEVEYEKYLKIPRRLSRNSITPSLRHRRLSMAIDPNEEIFNENNFNTQYNEEQSSSYKSMSHILEENKPWITKLTDNGTIQHVIMPSNSSTRIDVTHV